jgi:hypothetical protein
MDSPTPEEVVEKWVSANSTVDQVEQDSTEPAQTPQTNKKLEIDVERIRSSVARLTSNSIAELEKLTSELERLQEFLKSETERVQHEIGNVLAGIGLIIEAIAPWTPPGAGSAQNTRANGVSNGRDKLKRWPWWIAMKKPAIHRSLNVGRPLAQSVYLAGKVRSRFRSFEKASY